MVDLVAGSDGINLNFLQIFSIGGVGTADELITMNGPITFTTEKYLPNRSRLSFSSSGDRLLIGDRESTFRMIDFKKLAEYKQDINYKEGNKSEAVYRERLNKAIKSIKLKGLSGIIYEPLFTPDENRVLLRIGIRIVLWNPAPKPMLSHTLTHPQPFPGRLKVLKKWR